MKKPLRPRDATSKGQRHVTLTHIEESATMATMATSTWTNQGTETMAVTVTLNSTFRVLRCCYFHSAKAKFPAKHGLILVSICRSIQPNSPMWASKAKMELASCEVSQGFVSSAEINMSRGPPFYTRSSWNPHFFVSYISECLSHFDLETRFAPQRHFFNTQLPKMLRAQCVL